MPSQIVAPSGGPEERFRLLLEDNACPMWVFDAETLAFLAVNAAAARAYGYSREEFGSMTMKDIHPPEGVPRLLAVMGGLPDRFYEGVWRHVRRDGTRIDVALTTNRLDWAGQPAHLAVARDVTQRVAVESALRETEERFRLMTRAANDTVWDWNLETNDVWWTDGVNKILGYRSEEVGLDPAWWARHIHPDDRARVIGEYERVLVQGESVWSDTYRFRRSDGSYIHIDDRGFVIRDRDGKPLRMIGAMSDITARTEAETALHESEERLRQMADAIQDVFYLADAVTNEIIYINPAFDRIWGVSRLEIQARPRSWLERVHPEDRERVTRRLTGWRPERETPEWNEEFRIVRPDETVRWLWIRSFPIRDASGAIVRFAGVERDITERKQAEETIHSLLAITRQLNATLDVDVLMEALVRETLRLLDAESGFAGLATPRGVACRRYFTQGGAVPFAHEWAPGEGLPGWVAVHKSVYLTNDAARDAQIVPELRERFGIRSALCVPLLDPMGDVLGFIEVHNATDGAGFGRSHEEKLQAVSRAASVAVQNALAYHKLQETAAALGRAEEKYRGIFENAVEGIGQATPDGRFLTANPALARMLGYESPEELIRGVTDTKRLYVDPDIPEQIVRMLEKDGAIEGLEVQVRRRDGTPIWLLMNMRAARDERGVITHNDGIVQDVTARKKTEEALREVSGLLLQSQNEERRRIARELHDSTAQTVAALAMNLATITKGENGLSAAARTKLSDSLGLAQQCCRELRTLSYLLHPPFLEEGDLWSAVRWYTEGFSSRSGIHVDLALPTPGRSGRLPADVESTLFRIVQESLANIHRHSGSRRARISIARGAARVTLVVRDHGRGLRAIGGRRSGGPELLGVGIAGMRERVRQLGGELQIDSSGRGTAVKVMLPLPREH